MPPVRRPNDPCRNLRRRAPCAIGAAEPDQDRHLMTIVTHPAPHPPSPPPPAARRNTSPMSPRGRQSPSDRCERLAAAHLRHRKQPPSPLPLKTLSAASCRQRARQPSAIRKSP